MFGMYLNFLLSADEFAYARFKKSTPRLHFVHDAVDASSPQSYNLLTIASVLAGMQSAPSLRNPELHTSLYTSLTTSLSKTMIKSPLTETSMYSILVICTLNLTMGYSDDYLDAWLISGSLILHLMLAVDFPPSAPVSLLGSKEDRNRVLAWNIACLQHLKYV